MIREVQRILCGKLFLGKRKCIYKTKMGNVSHRGGDHNQLQKLSIRGDFLFYSFTYVSFINFDNIHFIV